MEPGQEHQSEESPTTRLSSLAIDRDPVAGVLTGVNLRAIQRRLGDHHEDLSIWIDCLLRFGDTGCPFAVRYTVRRHNWSGAVLLTLSVHACG